MTRAEMDARHWTPATLSSSPVTPMWTTLPSAPPWWAGFWSRSASRRHHRPTGSAETPRHFARSARHACFGASRREIVDSQLRVDNRSLAGRGPALPPARIRRRRGEACALTVSRANWLSTFPAVMPQNRRGAPSARNGLGVPRIRLGDDADAIASDSRNRPPGRRRRKGGPHRRHR